jgi:predicted MPP superfamily phosphohydrolase
MKFLRPGRMIFWGIILAMAGYAFLIEPVWVEVTHHPVGNGSSGDRIRVAQLSDLHLQNISRTEENTLEAVRDIAPDVILLTGDVVDRPDTLSVLDAYLAKLDAPVKLAVLGNWEYWGGVDQNELRKTYARHGVRLLINECVEVFVGDRSLRVAGLDDFTAGRPDPNKFDPACLGNGSDLILIQHSPGYFEGEKRPSNFPKPAMSLSGHTHGGQVSLFGYAFWTPPGSGSFNRGWYDTDWGKLYVSRGVGTSLTKVRFASRPEIAVFELQL